MNTDTHKEIIERIVIKRLHAMGLEPIVMAAIEKSSNLNLHYDGMTISHFNIWTGEDESTWVKLESYRGAGEICQLVIEFKKRKKLNPNLRFYLSQLYYDYDIQKCERTLTMQGAIHE